ncbi:MAG: aldo/keto reductase [Lachnospiraceae bacterium]
MKNFGFGCMRLPMNGSEVDTEQFKRMIDRFLEEGFTYFDTAHGYLDGKSETAIRECLTARYPRERYQLTDKLTQNYFEKEEDIRPLFESQLAACGVTYFDYYLMHAMTAEYYPKYVACHAFEIAQELKAEGKIRHIGMSFHDKAQVLDRILSEHPEIEVVQLQFNYADYDDPGIQSYACYQVCEKYHKPVIVMEPVKGGSLINLPEEAKKVLDDLNGGSYASYAIRYCASFPQIFMVLSGMSDLAQMEDNISYMKEFVPFCDAEYEAVEQVRRILKGQDSIACTACRYCTAGCPRKISIPDLFSCYNAKKQYQDWNSDFYYGVHTAEGGKASDCIACGKCEHVCPQHLPIRDLLKEVAVEFEK